MSDTQLNEALNAVIARYAPKNRSYGMSMSLSNRIAIVTGIHNMSHNCFWKEVFELLELQMTTSMHKNLNAYDRRKDLKRQYIARKDVKEKRVRVQNEQLQEMVRKQIEDEKRGSTYSSSTAFNHMVPIEIIKIEEEKKHKNNIDCGLYGCHYKYHKSNKSKKCFYYTYNNDEDMWIAMDERLRVLYPSHFGESHYCSHFIFSFLFHRYFSKKFLYCSTFVRKYSREYTKRICNLKCNLETYHTI